MTIIELINYGLNRNDPLDLPNSPPIENLQNEDNEMHDYVEDMYSESILSLEALSGLKYGGVIQSQEKIDGNHFYLDKYTVEFYFYKNLGDNEVQGPFDELSYNWIPFKLGLNKLFLYEGFPDISTGLLSIYNQIENLKKRSQRLKNDVNYLTSSKYPVGTIIHGYFPEDTEIEGYIDISVGMVLKTDYPELYELLKGSVYETTNYFRIQNIGGRTIRINPETLGVLEEDTQMSHAHSGTTNESGVHNHTIYMGGNGGDEGAGVPSDSDSSMNLLYKTPTSTDHEHEYITSSVGGTEFRCRNVALRALIKYK